MRGCPVAAVLQCKVFSISPVLFLLFLPLSVLPRVNQILPAIPLSGSSSLFVHCQPAAPVTDQNSDAANRCSDRDKDGRKSVMKPMHNDI